MAQRILRPLSYGDLFDELFDLYKKHFVLFVGISAVVEVPIYAILYAIGGKGASVAVSVLSGVIAYVVMAATTWAVSQCYLGNETSIADSYKAIGHRLVPFFVTMIVVGLCIFAGFLLLVIPGIILAFRFAFVSEVFILEGKTLKDAMGRSAQLTKDNYGRIFVIGLLATILAIVVSMILTIPTQLLAAIFAGNAQTVGGPVGLIYGVMAGIASALTTPLQVMAFVLLYYDVRVRKEGFDIQMLASNLGMQEPASSAVENNKE
ncbi:MAG: glycerophosphoryl diester phosphodiesterase membrane domain-containing protein [Armatimonadota bacterium]|nr:glycerophosphoryl diester phosphodiesterase membrane domain-containing protein [bacterium]